MAWSYDETFREAVKIWPAEPVVAFFESLREELLGQPVLDHGCGGGRHSIYMARRGAAVRGVDLSPVGVEHAREWAAREQLEIELTTGDFRRLPYDDAAFAAVVSWESAFYGAEDAVRGGVAEILRVTRSGGRLLVMLKSLDDFRFSRFARLGPRTCDSELGIAVTGFSRDDVSALFSGACRELRVETLSFSIDDGATLISNFLVHATRG